MGLCGLFKPKWKHRKWAVRESAVRNMKSPSQSRLLQIAVNDTDGAVRQTALERLVELWINSKTGFAKTVEQFHDLDILMRIAMDDNIRDLQVRAVALERLGNQEMLCNVAKSQILFRGYTVNRAGRHSELSKTEIRSIKTIANNIRILATKRITDQIILTEIAKGIYPWATWPVRLAAAESIADPEIAQPLLGEIASNGDLDSRKAAADKLTDRGLASTLLAKMSFDIAQAEKASVARKQAEALAKRLNLQFARQENCHHDYVEIKGECCDFCQQWTSTKECRICGKSLHHICH